MNGAGQPERATQNRVMALFRDELEYRYLGDWADRAGNSNIEEGLLSDWLTRSGCTPAQIGVALHRLRTEATNHSRTLYGNNQAVYNLLRYGVPVKGEPGINGNEYAQLPVSLPNTDEQTAITAVLSGMASEISAVEIKLAKARQLKQAMMQELLTGRIRLA